MFKIKINNIDILPYIIIFLVIISFSFFQLSTRNILKTKYEWELGFFAYMLIILGVLNYIKRIHNPPGVNLSDLKSTEDIRTPTYEYKGIINKGTNISFVKFYFSSNEVYMYYRNFFPIKIYYGPFGINKKGNISGEFNLIELTKTNIGVKLHIESQNKMISYTIYMKDINKEDFDLLENHLNSNN